MVEPHQAGTTPAVSHELIRRFARPSKPAEKEDLVILKTLLEVAKLTLAQGVASLIEEASNRPLLISYAADCTPTVSTHRSTFELPGHKTLHRADKGCDEYLVQVLFAAYFNGSDRRVVAKVGEPVPLNYGKGAVALWSCTKAFSVQPVLDCGHRGICIHHYSWDRACFSSQSALVRQWHTHSLQAAAPCDADLSKHIRYLLTWVSCTACAEHDCHKAQEWAMHAAYQDTELLKRIHVACEALRNSYPQILKLLPRFVAEIQVLPLNECMSDEHLQDIWQVLGVSDDTCAELVSLRLICVGGKLQATIGQLQDTVDQLQGAMATEKEKKPSTVDIDCP